MVFWLKFIMVRFFCVSLNVVSLVFKNWLRIGWVDFVFSWIFWGDWLVSVNYCCLFRVL